MLRTNTCGELSAKNIEEEVILSGWMHRRRDLGGLIFFDLRDRYGLTQVIVDPKMTDAHEVAENIRAEFVLKVSGKVQARAEGQANKEMPTGEIEIFAEWVEIINEAKTPPFEISSETEVQNEDLRLEYRYLDLRREKMQKNLVLRNDMTNTIRSHFHRENFIDIETPIMVKGTPEGSREYLVPSRLHPGKFYVLPQSPQQLKQLLMVGGLDKYFQIARCFRDEDLRGDRQPEFTQFEIEASFVEQDDVIDYIERCFYDLNENHAKNKEWKKFMENGKFKQLTWLEAMTKYGSDKPDLRFGLELIDIAEISRDSGFGVFDNSERVFALAVKKELGEFSRKNIDKLEAVAKQNGAKGLAWWRAGEETGAVGKNTTAKFREILIEKTEAKDGDMIFFGAGDFISATEPLGAVRSKLGDNLGLKNSREFAYCWVVDFPLFEAKDDGSMASAHHPFTAVHPEDAEMLKSEPLKCRALAYDIVLNGVELGGGSIRIHDPILQKEIFKILGMNEEEISRKFGHLLKAFEYGCPPHGGCAMGLDRVVMMFADEPNIREVMAFPKNQMAIDLMLGAPSPMPEKELEEQNIRISKS